MSESLKRSPAEELAFAAILRVQGKKHNVTLADVTAQLAVRNIEMARYLRSRDVDVGEYYAKALGPKIVKGKR